MSTVVVDRLGLVVQMRLDSSRLPRKALLPLGPGSLAYAVMHRLKAVHADDYILATDDAGAIELAEAASLAGFALFAGPKDDVLLRYVLAASEFGLSRIMRATGDNPFVSVPLADMLAQRNRENQADYAG
ncbi:MAG TPA: acylneuraminate cytidylyltransferase, partial [Spirochaetales bacterium]|nr:acylneuraminate cytidylyltransferase [Spirochaetales bacterium]